MEIAIELGASNFLARSSKSELFSCRSLTRGFDGYLELSSLIIKVRSPSIQERDVEISIHLSSSSVSPFLVIPNPEETTLAASASSKPVCPPSTSSRSERAALISPRRSLAIPRETNRWEDAKEGFPSCSV